MSTSKIAWPRRPSSSYTRTRTGRSFLNYWCFSVHGPWQGKPELIAKYRALAKSDNPQHNAVYGAMVESMDDAVGTLMRTLDETGLAKNTIVVFTSDNGGVDFADVGGIPVTSNAPLRAGKATSTKAESANRQWSSGPAQSNLAARPTL